MDWLQPLRVLWLAAPVIVAAVVHIAVIKLKLLEALKRPLDLGRTFRGRRLFGDNKTWRGALVMAGGSAAAAPLQGVLRLRDLELFDYGTANLPLVGLLLGLGFVVAELPNSFLKRQADVPPGERGPPWAVVLDQVDSVIGCLVFLCLAWVPPLAVWVWVLVLCTGVHMALNGVFVLLGLKKSVF
jgi:hypothetical protein